jgi:hypothetical protein
MKRKRALSILLLILVLLLQIPVMPVRAADEIAYEREYLEQPLFNASTKAEPGYFIEDTGNSIFNVIDRFTKVHGGAGLPAALSFDATISGSAYNAWYTFYFNGKESELAQKGDIGVAYTANLTNDSHINILHHWDTRLSYPYTVLGSAPYSHKTFGKDLHIYAQDTDTCSTSTVTGNYEFKPVGTGFEAQGLNLRLLGAGCIDGRTSISAMAVMLADVQGPAVTEIYTTRNANPASSVFTQFHAGEDIYIHLKFDESIRFAEDAVTGDVKDMILNIGMKRIIDQVELGGISAKASLVSLRDDILTFKYNVPPTISIGGSNKTTNFYLDKVDYNNQSTWISSRPAFDVKLLYKKPGDADPTIIPLSDKAIEDDMGKATSLVVDLAGNGIDTVKSRTSFNSNCYMDNVAPSIKTVTIDRVQKNSRNTTDRGNTFTTEGDKNGFWVQFSEEMIFKNGNDYIQITDANVGKLSVQLNIKDSGGDPVVVEGSKTDPDDRSRFYFEYAIQAGDEPLVYPAAGDQAIGVNRIYSTDPAFVLADSRGNPYSENTEFINTGSGRIMPEQELWLDVTAPTVAAGEAVPQSGGKYAPLSHSGGASSGEFYFPLIISDVTGPGGDEYVSGTNGLKGVFRWENEVNNPNRATYQFKYCIGGIAVPADDYFKTATTWEDIPIPQIDGGEGNVIHIRFVNGMDYSLLDTELVVKPVDYAGNTAEVRFPLDYVHDNIGPRMKLEGYSNSFDSTMQKGEITAKISIRDIKEMAGSVWLQWVSDGGTPLEDGWTNITDDYTGSARNKSFSIVKSNLDTDVNHQFDLYIRTLNQDGSVTVKSFDFDYDLTKPKYELEFDTNPEDVLKKHSVIFKEPDGSTDVTAITLIKDERTENEYWVKNAYLETNAEDGDPFVIDDIFGIPTIDEINDACHVPETKPPDFFAYWRRCTVTEDVYHSIVIDQLEDLGKYEGSFVTITPSQEDLSGLFNNSYGPINVKFIAAYKEQLQLNNGGLQLIIPNTANYVEMNQSFNFRCDTGYEVVHDITITPMTDDGMPESHDRLTMGINHEYALEGLVNNEPQVLRSLDGLNFKVEIDNVKHAGYGIADVDFESPNTFFELLYDPPYGGSSVSVYRTPLKAAASQVVQIPAGAAIFSGHYHPQVFIDRKSFPGESASIYDDYGSLDVNALSANGYTGICVDRETIDSFGVKTIESEIDFGGVPVPVKTEFQLSPGVRPYEIFLSTAVDSNVVLEADYAPSFLWHESSAMGTNDKAHYTHAYVRVWNKEDPSLTSGWKELVYDEPSENHDTGETVFDGTGEYAFSSDELIALAGAGGGDLCYQFMASSADKKMTVDGSGNLVIEYMPYTTPVQILAVRTSGESPAFDMTFTPDPDTGNVITAVGELASIHSAPEALKLIYAKQGDAPVGFTQGNEPVIGESGTYHFAAYDKYHNYAIVSQTLEIDKTAPVLDVDNHSLGNRFAFTAEITDENAGGLVISFDDDYNSLLGFDTVGGEDVEFRVPEAGGGSDGIWCATMTNDNGIYRTVTEVAAGKKTITVEGVFKYDESAGNGATITRTVTLHAVDTAGNRSAERSFLITAANTQPAYDSGAYNTDDGFKATFTVPVILKDPAESASTPVYELQKKHMPIYENGDYTIQYTDIFGANHSENITVSAYDSFYDVGIAISETGPTNQDVTVTLDASGNSGVTLGLPAESGNMTVEPTMSGGEVKGAVITIKENREFSFDIVPIDGLHSTVTRTIRITNIDRTAPTAELAWIFTADVDDNGQTKGEVKVSLIPDEAIKAVNGKATMHAFTLNDQGDYTFEYTDAAGNPGSPLTASLNSLNPPVTIVEKTLQDSDATPPDYEMDVYKTLSGSFVKVMGYTRTEYDAAAPGNPFSNPAYVSGAMRLVFSVKDINQTRMLLFNGIKNEAQLAGVSYGSAGETVAGITPGGNSVYISGNASFTIVFIDAKNNKTLVPVVITQIDNIPPTGVIQYVPEGFYSIRAYVILRDNMPGAVTMRTTTGVVWDGAYPWSIDTESGPVTGTGAYYHKFDANDSFTFTFEDGAGNMGNATATVSTLDETRPEVTRVTWSPCLIGADTDGDGQADADSSQSPAKPVNSDITAYVTFSRNVRTLTAALIDDEGNLLQGYAPEEYFILTRGAADATVAFKQGARLRLTFAALNGAANAYVLEVADVIDKQAPVITIASDEPAIGAVKTVKLTFSSNEPAYYMGNGAELKLNEENGEYECSVNLPENGTYRFSFVDKAGNIREVQYAASKIDNTTPVITVSGIPETKAQVQDWNSDPANAGNQKTHASTKDPITFQASANEAGKLTFAGETMDIQAGDSVTLTVSSNGYYGISAEDEAGNTAYESFLIDRIDTAPPSVVFERSVMKVKQETLLAEFEAAALQDAIVSDNYEADMTGRYSLTGSLTQQQLNTPGTYRITYTAADSAGNTKTVERTVYVYDKTQPTMLINSIKADDGGTLFFTTDVIEVVVELPDAGNGTEPFKLHYAAGLKTAGQMKTAGKLLTVSGGQATFTAQEEGFYTLYMVTQSRKTFITHLYVQK